MNQFGWNVGAADFCEVAFFRTVIVPYTSLFSGLWKEKNVYPNTWYIQCFLVLGQWLTKQWRKDKDGIPAANTF